MSEKIKWLEPHQRFAFCALSVIPVRAEPKDSAEQSTQLLFGEPIEIIAFDRPWLKIRSFLDGYEGYIDHKQVLPLTEKELRQGEPLKPMILNAVNSRTMRKLTGSAFIDDWNNIPVPVCKAISDIINELLVAI